MKKTVLGLNTVGFNTSASLIINNKLVSAVEEERLSREKRTRRFPLKAINFCLKQAKLKYEDLRKAHTETVIPITRDDFNACPKFADLESYKQHRAAAETEPMTIAEARRFISDKNDREGKHNVKRAFKILKQDEEIEKSHNQWWSYIKQLEDR